MTPAAEPEPDLAHAEQLAQFKQVTAAAVGTFSVPPVGPFDSGFYRISC